MDAMAGVVPQDLADYAGELPNWLAAALILGATMVVALFLHSAARRVATWLLDQRLGEFGRKLLQRIAGPSRFGLVVAALGLAVHATPLEGGAFAFAQWILLVLFIIFVGWSAAVVVDTAADLYMRRVPGEAEDGLLARKLLTQIRVLRRLAVIIVGVLTFAAVLMTLPAVREYGVSLFASAGVAGIVAGLAARPVLSNLIAGVQLAITQPIRIEDAVVVEGEFGFVEEIRTTYVVVRLWDLRRLVVPLSYFIEKPFQNWARQSGSLIGSVFWYVDYAAPVDAVRQKFMELVSASPLWDGKTAVLQVTEVRPDSVQLRGLMSASSAGAAFDLRCQIREAILDWLQQTYPEALPKVRAAQAGAPGDAGAAEAVVPARSTRSGQ